MLHPAEAWYTCGTETEVFKFDGNSQDQSGHAGLCSSPGTVVPTVHL